VRVVGQCRTNRGGGGGAGWSGHQLRLGEAHSLLDRALLNTARATIGDVEDDSATYDGDAEGGGAGSEGGSWKGEAIVVLTNP
jgi:hypothetical protein